MVQLIGISIDFKLCMIQEYIDGPSLKDIIHDMNESLCFDTVLDVSFQLCEGMI